MGTRTISNSFFIKGSSRKIFDWMSQYIVALKFQIISSQRPYSIVANRGSKIGANFGTSIQNASTTLNITLSKSLDGVQILIQYNVHLGLLSVMTSGDRAYIDNEIQMLKTFLVNESQKSNISTSHNSMPPATFDSNPQLPSTPPNYLDELEQLAKLMDKGIITEDEFTTKKRQLLGLK